MLGLTAVAAVIAPAPAYAAQPLWLGVNQSYYLGTHSPITKAVVGNPKIADIQDLGTHALNIVALGQGATTVNVWTADGMRQDFTVNVNDDTNDRKNVSLAAKIKMAINLPHVTVQVIEDRVLLRGTVRNQYEKDLAFKIACLYVGEDPTKSKQSLLKLGGNSGSGAVKTEVVTEEQVDSSARVINLLDMENPDQINMEALVIEINSDAAKKLGVTYASEVQNNTTGTGVTLGDSGLFYGGESFGVQRDAGSHWYNRNWLFTHFSKVNAQLRLLVEQGKARVVSRPNITTMSGKSAGILVGGQIPYPSVSGLGNNITVEYKPYGISLNIVNPTVDRQGNIVANLNAEVSRLDWTNSVTANGYRMPGLSTRSAQTVVTIPTGMTMAIGGLLNSEDTKTLSKLPVLGDIPVLGELFKYHNTSRQKSEIMILITPRVVNEHDEVKMSPKMEEAFQDSRREYRDMRSVDLNGAIPEKQSKKQRKDAPAVQAEESSPLDKIIPVDSSQSY
ncbi:type II and III secretion system protein family protein [Selenomonas ruminantium]|uniref:type II and III secretion system protein family protein n=1 Tax=Selenomonas ruminantium TaxID=971 RepID=UPI0021142FC9|nr:pilus assembly protein N-terminal domain-containing protein [Selenomonas ruminantium]